MVNANTGLEQFGLKVRHYSILSLAVSQKEPTQKELSNFLRLDPSLIVSAIDELENRGWVTREPSTIDRRSKILVATAEGIGACAKMREAMHASSRQSIGFLSVEERATLRGLLKRIAYVDIVHPGSEAE